MQIDISDTNETNAAKYERERGKPLPGMHHATIQVQLSYLLQRDYSKKFTFPSELDLDLDSKYATPDLCIYPKMDFDYATDDDVIKTTEPPLTTIEILSPKQALGDVISKIRKIYFPNQVQSSWVIMPPLKTIVLLLPGKEPSFFVSGKLTDPATGVEVSVEEVFEV